MKDYFRYAKSHLLEIIGASIIIILSLKMVLLMVCPGCVFFSRVRSFILLDSSVFTVKKNRYSNFLGGDYVIIVEKMDGTKFSKKLNYMSTFNHSHEKIVADLMLGGFNKYQTTNKKSLTRKYIAAKQLLCFSDYKSVTIERTYVSQDARRDKITSSNIIDCKE